jgi:hypothetical protein
MNRLVPLLVSAALLASCGGDGSGSSTTPSAGDPVGTGAATAPPGDPTTPNEPVSARDFDPADFDPATPVDNGWFPLTPGTQFVYEGSSLDDGERLQHEVVFTVSDMVKEVAGVRVVVIWDRDYTEGELVEEEIAFFAQDREGNVWHLGQYPEEFENAKLHKSPGWVAGEEGARAGIAMKDEPKLGDPSYSQGFAPPPINWDDRGRTYKVGTQTCVPADCYEDVLVIEEYEPSKPGAFQLKHYAPGVGNVRVGWRGKNEEEHEVLELIEIRHLDGAGMEEVRTAVLQLDAHAYERIPAYGATSPAELA